MTLQGGARVVRRRGGPGAGRRRPGEDALAAPYTCDPIEQLSDTGSGDTSPAGVQRVGSESPCRLGGRAERLPGRRFRLQALGWVPGPGVRAADRARAQLAATVTVIRA